MPKRHGGWINSDRVAAVEAAPPMEQHRAEQSGSEKSRVDPIGSSNRGKNRRKEQNRVDEEEKKEEEENSPGLWPNSMLDLQ